jgi:hypothetical protein
LAVLATSTRASPAPGARWAPRIVTRGCPQSRASSSLRRSSASLAVDTPEPTA